MSCFIQSLERRVLLTTTAAALSADLNAASADAVTVKADLLALQTAGKADLKKIATDLKGSVSSNAPLLKTLTTAQTKMIAKIAADVTALLKATGVAKRGAADGAAVLSGASGAQGKISGDVLALSTATVKPSSNLTTDSSTIVIGADLTALTTANPAVSADATKDLTDLNTLTGKLKADAATFSTVVGSLKTALSTLLPVPTTTPSLVGDYKGTLKTQAIVFGLGSQTLDFEIVVVTQTINSITGSITAAGHSASGTITATELSNGKLTLKINDSGFTVTLNGKVNISTTARGLPPGSVITGTGSVSLAGFSFSGSFVVTKVT